MAWFFRSLQRGLAVVGGVTVVGVGGATLAIRQAQKATSGARVLAGPQEQAILTTDWPSPAPAQNALQRQLNLPEQFVLDIDLEDIVLVEKSVPNPLLQARQQAYGQ